MGFFSNLRSKFTKVSAKPHINTEPYRATGIDVSKWQGNIDWRAVKASGIDFAMIRIGYGSFDGKQCVLDPKFKANVQNAISAGIDVGAYFYTYALTEQAARNEADFVLNILSKYPGVFKYPIAYDIEDNKILQHTNNQIRTDMVLAFTGKLERAGYYASVYANLNWFKNYLQDTRLQKLDHWLAQWSAKPTYAAPSVMGMWQYTSDGSVSGISGRVDRNYAYRDYPVIIRNKNLNGYSIQKQNTDSIKHTEEVKSKQINTSSKQPVSKSFLYKKGDRVFFGGSKQFSSSTKHGKAMPARSGWATITLDPVNNAHPYHIVHTSKESNVYGWVNKSDIYAARPNKKAASGSSGKQEFKRGNKVRIKKGAKTYTGGGLMSFVYDRVHTISEISGNRAVVEYKGTVVAPIHIKNLIKISDK